MTGRYCTVGGDASGFRRAWEIFQRLNLEVFPDLLDEFDDRRILAITSIAITAIARECGKRSRKDSESESCRSNREKTCPRFHMPSKAFFWEGAPFG
jgi:hypothetical protein